MIEKINKRLYLKRLSSLFTEGGSASRFLSLLPQPKSGFSAPKNNQGQAILVIVLVMVVALTIGLSVSSRLVTDIKMSTQMEESQRAFSAAEAGIEYALSAGLSKSQGVKKETIGSASYAVKAEEIGGEEIIFPSPLAADESYQIWFVNQENLDEEIYNKDSIKILWGNSNPNWGDDNNTPAIKVVIVYKDGTNYKFGKFALDPRSNRGNNFCFPNGTNCSGVLNFKTDGEEIGGNKQQFSAVFDLSSFTNHSTKILQLLRFKLLYNSNKQLVAIKSLEGGSLPVQGKIIESVGTSGETVREFEVIEFNPSLPTIFDFSLFSAGNITK